MLPSSGLYGRARNAALLSLVLLAGYVVLAEMCWGLLMVVQHALRPLMRFLSGGPSQSFVNILAGGPGMPMPLTGPELFMRDMGATWHLPIIVVVVWWMAALVFHRVIVQFVTGATSVTRAQEPRLYNIVENTAIAAGLPMPTVGIIETPARNAYASGLFETAATIAVTRGLLDALDDRELQAVVAHEFVHIRNGDTRVMLIATVFNGFVTFIATFIWERVKTMVADPKVRAAACASMLFGGPLILGAGLVFSLMSFIGLAVAAAISRLREHVADAGALEITHDVEALISALGKIAGHERIAWLNTGMSGFMFADPSGSRWLTTHPELSARVAAINEMRAKYRAKSAVRGRPQRTAARSSRQTIAFGRRA
jgi:heat shock protein HtpX